MPDFLHDCVRAVRMLNSGQGSEAAKWAGSLRSRILDAVDDPAALVGSPLIGIEHPNGFTKITLWDGCGSGTARLHIWSPLAGEGDLHSHRWDFISTILQGSLAAEDFRIAAGDDHSLFKCRSSPFEYDLEFSRRTGLIRVENTTRRSGDSYFQPSDLLHRASALADGCISFVLCGAPKRPYSTVVLQATTKSDNRPVVQLSSAEAIDALTLALRRVRDE